MDLIIMMNTREYRSRSVAASARAELETDGVAKAHHHADAASWKALAEMADRHAVVMAGFKV